MKYVKAERITLKEHPEFNEKWVQQRIAEDPSILGLGNLVLKDSERRHPHAGRLDLLFQDSETDDRYVVELQLGATDESHIIRTLEYWDIEKRRYPQYDHRAVLIAEDITSRFFNVIGLFNSCIPIIAIKMNALKIGDGVSLGFTTVLDELERGREEEEEHETTDRAWWEQRATKESVAIADKMLELVRPLEPGLGLKYNKFYIGLAKDGSPNNFVTFRPRKAHMILEARLPQTPELTKTLEESGLDFMDYDKKWGRYRVRLTAAEVASHKDFLTKLLQKAHDEGKE